MSIQADIQTALSDLEWRAFPDAAQQGAPIPLIIYRRSDVEPQNTLMGYEGTARSTFIFECWAKQKGLTLDMVDAVNAAIEEAFPYTAFRESISGEDYEPLTDEVMTPTSYSIWHS